MQQGPRHEQPAEKPRQRERWMASSAINEAPSEQVPELVASLTLRDFGAVDTALNKLLELTMWQVVNQRAAMELGAPSILMQLLRTKLEFVSPNVAEGKADLENKAVTKSLNLLLNLSSNDDLASRVASVPGCVAFLVGLLSHTLRPLVVMAARCLINLTHSSTEGQAEAERAGLLQPAISFLLSSEPDFARCKLGGWLVANLVSPDEAPARQQLLAHSAAVKRMVSLVQQSSTPVPVLVFVCRALASLARQDYKAQSTLAEAGALAAVAALVEAPGASSEVLAAALPAVSALVLDHSANTSALMARPGLAPALGLALETRSSAFATHTPNDSATVLAAHVLVHVTGHMLLNGGHGLAPPSECEEGEHAEGPVAKVQGPDADWVDGRASVVVPGVGAKVETKQASKPQQVVCASLSTAARAINVQLPAVVSLVGKHGEPVLSSVEAAELRHRVSHELLPQLRSPNHRAAALAAASLYHLVAACSGPAAREARRLVADSALVSQLLSALGEGDPALALACLVVLDVLSAEPTCTPVMMATGWMPIVVPLLSSKDALVRRWAERALCSLYMATGSVA